MDNVAAQGSGNTTAAPEDDSAYTDWPADPEAGDAFAVAVCGALRTKGYCIVRAGSPPDLRRGMLQAAQSLDYQVPRPEFAEAYLGQRAESKLSWLGAAPEGPASFYAGRTMDLVAVLSPLLEDFLGFAPWGFLGEALLRTPLAHPGEGEALAAAPLSEEDVVGGVVEQHLDFLQRRKLSVMYMIDDGGSIELHPREDLGQPPVALSIAGGEILLFRHDLIGYAYLPNSRSDLVLQAWIMEAPQALKLDSFEGDQRGVEALAGGPPMAMDKQVHIMCGHCKFPGSGYYMERAWLAWACQTDCFIEIPTVRWDVMEYYSEEAGVPGKAVAKHCGMLAFDELATFDHDFFGYTESEAHRIPPGQRVMLECTAEAFKMGLGLSMRELRGQPIACLIADIGADWDYFEGMRDFSDEWLRVGGIGFGVSSSARVGWTFGLTGPMHQVDTACSASLVAANILHGLVRKREKGLSTGIMMSYMNYFSPFPFVGLSSAGMLGRTGRSQTFDQSANGYARGEGVGGLVVKRTTDIKDTQDRQACYISSFINQDGRSASLTAPNGPSQQACIRGSMRDCQLRAEDVAITENHGTGTALGDPIEVGSIRALFRSRGERPVPVTSGKSHMGHLEAGAGAVGLLKTMTSLMHATVPPNVHLRHVNAHIEYEGFPGIFPTELTDIGVDQAVGGLNSFGFGGTNSRAELWARTVTGPRRQEEWWMKVEKLDYVMVPCPRCLGPMCWLCGVAVPTTSKGKHHCSAIREGLASYDYCSNCYGGSYIHGEELQDSLDQGQQIYLTGTWSAWTTFEKMELQGDVYVGEVVLGETLRERFRLVVERDQNRAIYPVMGRASPQIRIVGPDSLGRGKDWLIDGRRDGGYAGMAYRVTFEWGSVRKAIRWQPLGGEAPRKGGQRFEHEYFICGSLTAWTPVQMQKHPAEPTAWQYAGQIRTKGGATFNFLRDQDETQTIYPLESKPSDPSVPVMGPGDGTPTAESFQRWWAPGNIGELATVRLQVDNGEIVVSAHTSAMKQVETWRSPADKRDRYYVVGSFNGWTFSIMEPDTLSPDMYRLRFAIGQRSCEVFQIVANRNWETRFYPGHPRAPPGQGVVCGPNPHGNGLNWMVTGPAGQVMEIVFDLAEEDHCCMLSCQPCAEILE